MSKVFQKHNNNYSSKDETSSMVKQSLSANQLAAKALQLRMKGTHEEADKLLVSRIFFFFPNLSLSHMVLIHFHI